MTHRTSILRDQQATMTGWNQTDVPEWSPVAINVPCRAFFNNGREVQDGGKVVAVNALTVLLPLGTDITTDDKLGAITDRRGRTLHAGEHRVESIGHRRDHIAVALEVV